MEETTLQTSAITARFFKIVSAGIGFHVCFIARASRPIFRNDVTLQHTDARNTDVTVAMKQPNNMQDPAAMHIVLVNTEK